MTPHRVLHILYTAQPEGASYLRIVRALARGLDPSRYSLHVWFLGSEGPLTAELEAEGVPARALPWVGGVMAPRGAWRFWRSLSSEKFAIVHAHYGGRSVRWLARATGASVILHVHSVVDESKGLEPITIPAGGANLVVADCQAMADRVRGAQTKVVYLGAPVPGEANRPKKSSGHTAETIIGTVGRLAPIKGLTHLIQALALLRSEFTGLVLEIAGSGPLRSSLEQQARELGLANQVRFLGWLDGMAPVLARWDVFALASVQDGFPIAVLEAMAAGLPVVATKVGGLREMVEDGQTGWLVPPGDPSALAERLRALLLNPDQRCTMGMAGQARVRNRLSEKDMVTATAAIYNELLELGRRSTLGGIL